MPSVAADRRRTPSLPHRLAFATTPAPRTSSLISSATWPRVRFEAQGHGVQWRIDGKPLARGSSAQWLPWPGRHRVQLIDTRGQVADEIRLEVRGAGVVANARR